MKKSFFLIIFLSFFGNSFAQSGEAKIIDWKLLSKVDFVDKYYDEYEAWYLYPEFSSKIKKLDGEKVIIKGYIIPMDVEGGVYALSAYPFSSCFFCGGAGPESVMSLKFDGNRRKYKTDDVVTFTGTLELNATNVDDFNYILNNATEIDN